MRVYWKFLWLTAALVFTLAAGAAAGAPVRAVTLTWTEDPGQTQTITWQTEPGAPYDRVEYSEADTPDAALSSVRTAAAATRRRTTDDGARDVHSLTLRELKRGARYVYRIGDGENWVYDGSFCTEPPRAPFQFLLFGDAQSVDYSVWQTTFEAAVRAARGARFFVNVGDLVDNGQTQAQWDRWFEGVARRSGSLPLVPVVGNHETYAPGGSFSLPRYFMEQLPVPPNGPEGMKGQAYSFDYGDAHFVVLDSQFGEERAFLPDAAERQKAWLAADLAKADRPWKLVFMHRPVYHNRQSESAPDRTAVFAPVFDAYGVDAVFSGHDHVNARTPKLRAGAPDERGTVYATVGRSGTKTYATMEAKAWNERFFNPEQPTYSVVSVDAHVLYVRVFTQDGALLDEWSLMRL